MIDRRNTLRRTICGALVLVALAALPLAAVDAGRVLVNGSSAFDTIRERIFFAIDALGLSLASGVLGGILVGAALAASDRLARFSARARQPMWKGLLLALCVAPFCALAASRMFAGRRAQLLPAHHLLAVAAGLAALLAFYAAVRVALGIVTRITRGAGPASPLVTVGGVALLGLAGGLYFADLRVLPRLYPFFHLGLGALQLASVAGALGLFYLAAQRRGKRWGRLAEPWLALGIALLAVAGGAFALRRLSRDEAVRAAVYQHGLVEARLVELARAAGIAPQAIAPAPLPPPSVTPNAPPPLPPGPVLADADVFLITVDAMRADRLSARTAPHLFALAQNGVIFDRAYSQVPHTSFSLATLLTGKYVFSLSALGDDAAAHETLADVFQRDRYKTAAFFPPSVFFIDHDRFAEVERSAYHFEYVKYEHMGARGRTDQVIDFLESEKPPRVFTWIHYFEPHEPYDLHEGIAPDGHPPQTALERYDGEVAFVDGEIDRLVNYLHRTRPRAIIAFSADHGEEFGEHGGRYHGTTLYEEQVHVPLFLVGPGLPARHVTGDVALIDLAPTLLGLAGITPSAKMRGQDLGPWLSAKGCDEKRLDPVFAEIGTRKLIAVGDDRLLCDVARDFCELYDLAGDPGEAKNLTGHSPKEPELKARLQQWMGEQSAFEHAPAGEDAAERARRVLERGRLGDRGAAREAAQLLGESDLLREQASQVLLELPPDPSTKAAIDEALGAHPDDVRLQALALRIDPANAPLAARLATWAAHDAPNPIDPTVRAAVALAIAERDPSHAEPLLATALDEAKREELSLQLIAALGATHDPRAASPLLAHLDDVRTRLEVVRALGVLPAKTAAPRLAQSIASEPYVPVRAEMAAVLGRLGDRRSIEALAKQFAVEKEPLVAGEIAIALSRLHGESAAGGIALARAAGWRCEAGGCLPGPGAALPLSLRDGDTLWLVAADGASGTLSVGDSRIEVSGDHRAVAVAIAATGRPTMNTLAGAPKIVAALPQHRR